MIKDVTYLDDCRESMIDGFRGERERDIISTGFSVINKHYNWYKKDVTVFAGIGGHGKSTVYFQFAVLLAKFNGTKFAVFSPEQDPPDFFYDDLIHMLTGLYPNKKYMNEDVYFAAMKWVNEHFFYVYPQDASPSPDYINDRFELLIKDAGVQGVCIDPFDQLENNWEATQGRDDRYVSMFLKTCKRFAIRNDIYYDIITHTNSTVTTNDLGDFNMPNVGHIAGGVKWNNNADNIIFTHRPFSESDPENNEIILKFAKIKKQKIVGVRGEVTLNFNRQRNRYFDAKGTPFDEDYGQGSADIDELFTNDNPF